MIGLFFFVELLLQCFENHYLMLTHVSKLNNRLTSTKLPFTFLRNEIQILMMAHFLQHIP